MIVSNSSHFLRGTPGMAGYRANAAMVLSRNAGMAGFGGDPWLDWCAKEYGGDGTLKAKCEKWYPVAPWTVAGKALRGLPQSTAGVTNAVQETAAMVGSVAQSLPTGTTSTAKPPTTIPNPNTTIAPYNPGGAGNYLVPVSGAGSSRMLMIGGFILAGALGLFLLKGRKRSSMAGYSKRRRRSAYRRG